MPTELTRLTAVNRMMTAIGMPSVDTLDSNVNALVSTARSILDEVELEMVSERWSFNTEYEISLAPDTDGFITVTSDILHADSEDPSVNVVRRGNRLYSLDTNSFEFEAAVEVTVIRSLPWDHLPPSFRNVIAKRATQYLAERFDRDGGLVQRLSLEADRAYQRLLIEDSDRLDANMLDNPEIDRFVRPGFGPFDFGGY